jgi:RNA polymerase sigma-70 factor (ECF subfamily)
MIHQSDIDFDLSELKKCMSELAEGYKTVLTLYLIEGYDHGEIAQILGITEATSKSQYSRAKKKLRELILQTQMVK